jgi:hypothetical protein
MSDLLGAQEAADLLGLSRQALHQRRQQPEFPAPVAELRATPVWERGDLLDYACARTVRLEERTAIARLAEEADDVVLRAAPVPVRLAVHAVATRAERGRLRGRR